MFEAIKKLIEDYPKIIIHRHKNPDGDALGAQMGLKRILMENYPEKQILAVGDMTPRYAFMATLPLDEIEDSAYEGALAILLDTSTPTLICDDRYTKADMSARIDHHIFCEKFADVEVTDTSFESCCGMIAAFAMECGWQVSAEAAKSLYTGMVTSVSAFMSSSIAIASSLLLRVAPLAF